MGRNRCRIKILFQNQRAMDLIQFETELRNELQLIPYVTQIDIKKRTPISLRGLIGLQKNYELTVFFNETFYIISFSLIFKDKRIWGIDRDNRIGWHKHPFENPELHEPINKMSIAEIITAFNEVCRKIYE